MKAVDADVVAVVVVVVVVVGLCEVRQHGVRDDLSRAGALVANYPLVRLLVGEL